MKYIFPRQFGLHNVFTSSVDRRETNHQFKDYTLREHEIKNAMADAERFSKRPPRQTKVPKRLREGASILVAKLQKLHTRCAYVELLKHYCPVEVS